jgi:hypothetical protein
MPDLVAPLPLTPRPQPRTPWAERSPGLPRWSRASSAPRLHQWVRGDDDEAW